MAIITIDPPSGGDDSTATQQALNDAASDGAQMVLAQAGTYLFGTELQIPANPSFTNHGIWLCGVMSPYTQGTPKGTVFKATDESMRSVLAVLSRNNRITAIVCNADRKATYGIYQSGAGWCHYEHVAANNAELDGWYVDENSGGSAYLSCRGEANGTLYATSGILNEYDSRVRSSITGTAATTSASRTITITAGTDLTTLGIRKGDMIRVGSTAATAFYGMIESVTATVVTLGVNFGNLPTATQSGQQYAIGVGDNFHHGPTGNSNISTHILPFYRSAGGSGMNLHRTTSYSDTVIGAQLDFNSFFGANVGAADNAAAVFGACIVRPYGELNIARDFWFGDVRDLTVISPLMDSPSGGYITTGAGDGTISHNGYEESVQYGAPQSFVLQVRKNGGTLEHRILSDLIGGSGSAIADKVSGANMTYSATPDLTGGATNFTNGAGVNSATFSLSFNTAAPSQNAVVDGSATVESNSTGNAYTVSVSVASENVNGTTKSRPILRLINAGVLVAWSNIPNGTNLAIRVNVKMK